MKMSALKTKRSPIVIIRGHLVGRIVRWDEKGPWVDFPGNPNGVILARSTASVGNTARNCQTPCEALLVFEGERSISPIVVDLLAPQSLLDVPVKENAGDIHKCNMVDASKTVDALVDGRRVILEGKDEIVLRCGKASITLRRNGRVVLRGTYLEARSKGVNRVKGGSVQLN